MGDCMLYEFKTYPSKTIRAREKTGKIFIMFLLGTFATLERWSQEAVCEKLIFIPG